MAETYKINSQNDEAEKKYSISSTKEHHTPIGWLNHLYFSDIYIEQENYFEAKQVLAKFTR